MHPAFGVDQHGEFQRELIDQRVELLDAADKKGRGQRVGQRRVVMNHGAGLRAGGGLAAAWIQQVVIAAALELEVPLVVAAGEYGLAVLQFDADQ